MPTKNAILYFIMLLPLIMVAQVKLSQDFKVTKITPFKAVDATSAKYIAVENGYTISVKIDGDKVVIQKIGIASMKEEKRTEYKDFPNYTQAISLLKSGDHLYYIYEAYVKNEVTHSVYLREVDVATATFKETKTLFTTTGEVMSLNNESRYVTGVFKMGSRRQFDVIPSADGTKFLIQYRNLPDIIKGIYNPAKVKKYHDVLGFYVFDNNFNKIWGKEVQMPHSEEEMDMNNSAYTINKDGTVYMLSKINEAKSYELITVSNSEGLKNKVLPLKKGLDLTDYDLTENTNGNIIGAGYYANAAPTKIEWVGGDVLCKHINGIYTFEFTTAGSIVKYHDYPFSADMINKNLSLRQKDKAEKEDEGRTSAINDLVLRKFIVNKDGSLVIIGEVNYTRKEKYITGMTMVVHFGNIVATKIDATGKLVWSEIMAKNQSVLSENNSENIFSLGISYIQDKGSDYLFFVDDEKNAALKMDEPLELYRVVFGEGYLLAYHIDDATGKIEKHVILDLNNIDGTKTRNFWVSKILKASDKIFTFEVSMKGKEDMMVKMEPVK